MSTRTLLSVSGETARLHKLTHLVQWRWKAASTLFCTVGQRTSLTKEVIRKSSDSQTRPIPTEMKLGHRKWGKSTRSSPHAGGVNSEVIGSVLIFGSGPPDSLDLCLPQRQLTTRSLISVEAALSCLILGACLSRQRQRHDNTLLRFQSRGPKRDKGENTWPCKTFETLSWPSPDVTSASLSRPEDTEVLWDRPRPSPSYLGSVWLTAPEKGHQQRKELACTMAILVEKTCHSGLLGNLSIYAMAAT